MLHIGTESVFCISIFVKKIVLLGISPNVSKVLTSQVGIKSISKPVFVQFHLGRKTLKFVNNHLTLCDVVTGIFTKKKIVMIQLAECIV